MATEDSTDELDVDFMGEDDIEFVDGDAGDVEVIEETPTGGIRGLRGAARRRGARALTQLSKGRLAFSEGEGENLTADARLASVVAESTPGAALDLLRQNTAFAFPDLDAFVVLVLPTTGSFGGLSKRSRTEDKGVLINLLDADNIHSLVTVELLEEDALGLIPDEESLQRMAEFSILVNAEYLYAVACEDIDTGGIRVFPVPVSDSDTAIHRKVFDQAVKISEGELRAAEIVDPAVVEAMLKVYRNPAADYGKGAQDLDKAVQVNSSFLVDQVYRDRYPSPGEVVANLAKAFPGVGIEIGAVGRHRVPGVAGAGEAPISAADFADRLEADGAEGTDAPAEETEERTTTEDAMTDDAELAEDEVVVLAEDDDADEVGAEPDFGDDDDTDDEGEQAGDAGPDLVPAQAAPRAAPDTADLVQALREATEPQLRSLREELLSAMGSRGPVRLDEAPVAVDPGSEFSYEEVLSSAQRRYLNSDLGLYVDVEAFRGRLGGPVPQVELPAQGTTPWLGEQAQALVAALNSQLRKYHEDSMGQLYRRYLKLADVAVASTNKEFDPRLNPDSPWGKTHATIEADRRTLEDRLSDNKLKAEEAVRAMWRSREQDFIDAATARARHEFSHRNATRIETEVRDAGESVILAASAISDKHMADLNALRATAARESLDHALSLILAELDEEFDTIQATEENMLKGVEATIRQYIDDHREEDLHQTSVLESKLASDKRYETALAQARAQIEDIQAGAEERIAAMRADMERRSQEHNEQLRIAGRTADLKLENSTEQLASLRAQLDAERRARQDEVAHVQTMAQSTVESHLMAKQAAIEERDDMRGRLESRKTVQYAGVLMLVVVVAVLAFLSGFLL